MSAPAEPLPVWLSAVPGGVDVRIKAVPGARTTAIVGPLGDRLKVRIAAPPEDGKANAALCAWIAESCAVAARAVTVTSGHGRAEKTVRIAGRPAAAVRLALEGCYLRGA